MRDNPDKNQYNIFYTELQEIYSVLHYSKITKAFVKYQKGLKMNTKQLLGKRIKELIKKKGLRQDELAEKIGIEPTALSNIVTGRNYPLFSTLEKILNILEISFADVFKFEHLDSYENLKTEVLKILDNNPDKIKDFYKIIKALTE